MTDALSARHSIDLAYQAVNGSSATPAEQKEIRKHLEAVDARLRPMVLDWIPKGVAP